MVPVCGLGVTDLYTTYAHSMTDAVTSPWGKVAAVSPKIGGRQEDANAESVMQPVATMRPSRWRRPRPEAGTPACNKYSSVPEGWSGAES